MHSTVLHPSPVKDGRRILGDKPANACLSPARNRNVDSFLTATSPVKRSLFDTYSPKKLLPSPSFAGQKRSIEQVDENQVNKRSLVQNVESKESSQGSTQSAQAARVLHAMTDTRSRSEHQQTHQPHTQTPSTSVPREANRVVPEDPETRKVFIQEKANLLRNRIQNAMRHVKDNQFDRRLSELEAHSRKYPRLSIPVTPLQKFTSVRHTSATPSTTPRQLQPAPELKSTDPKSNEPGLSSPPLSAGNGSQQDLMRTPTQKSHRQSGTADSPMQLSSPPATILRSGCDRREARDEDEADERGNEEKLARPSQQGDAVDGLLKLMKTADKYGNTNTWTG